MSHASNYESSNFRLFTPDTAKNNSQSLNLKSGTSLKTVSPLMDQDKIAEHLRDIEAIAQEILQDREEIIALDRKRQKNREALRALQSSKSVEQHTEKSWVMLGNIFMKLPSTKARNLLEKDQNQLDGTIANLRDNLRHKVNKLRDLERKPELKGFSLKPLSRNEMSAVNHVLGQT